MKATRLFFPLLLCTALTVTTFEPAPRAQDFREECATHLKRSATSRYPARKNNAHRHYESTIPSAAGRAAALPHRTVR